MKDETRRLTVKVTPRASRQSVVMTGPDTYSIRVCAVPESGKANVEMLKLLSKATGIAKSRFEIIRGHSSREKIIRIL